MEVENAGELGTLVVPVYGKYFVRKMQFFERLSLSFTYDVARKAATILRTAVSLRSVSSNPGVSIKTTGYLPSLKASETCTMTVQDLSPSLTANLDPLKRFMNCSNCGVGTGELCGGCTPR